MGINEYVRRKYFTFGGFVDYIAEYFKTRKNLKALSKRA